MSANNFRLTLDTIAPNGAITFPTELENIQRNITLTLTKGDAVYMKVWFDSNSSATEIPPDTGTGAVPWILADTSYSKTFSADGNYYAHVVLLDDVGNASPIYNSALIVADTQIPVVSVFYAYDIDSGSHDFVNGNSGLDRKFKIHVEANDTGTIQSGLKEVRISGNFEEKDTGKNYKTVPLTAFTHNVWEGIFTFNANLADTTSMQSFTAIAEDNSGNISDYTAQDDHGQCSIVFDPVRATASYTVKSHGTNDTLPHYVRAATNNFDVTINATDIAPGELAYYQLYGDIKGHTTPTNITWDDADDDGFNIIHVNGLQFLDASDSVADGNRTIHVVVADKAGNITTPAAITWVYDATNPTGTIYTDKNTPGTPDTDEVWISEGSGAGKYSSVTVHYTASDATSGLAEGYPKFYCNGSLIENVSGGSFSFNSQISGAIVATADNNYAPNVIRMDLKDNSGNTYSCSCNVYIEEGFEIDDLDLTGWTIYENVFNGTNKTNIAAVITNTVAPAAGRASLYVWIDNLNADNMVEPSASSLTEIGWITSPQTVTYSSILAQFAESANNYLHVKAVSSVGNVAYATVQFTVDETAPTFNLTVQRAHTPDVTNNIIITSAADSLSGLDKVKLTALTGTTLASGSFDWTTLPSAASGSIGQSYTVNIGNETVDGIYGVEVQVRDRANNITTHTVQWEYDKTRPGLQVFIAEEDGVTEKVSPTALQGFKARITFVEPDDTDTRETVWYQIYGDISATRDGSAITYDNSKAPGETGTKWRPFPSDDDTVLTETLYLTQLSENADADGENKKIYVILIDDAGNTSTITETNIMFNPMVAELVISDVTHNRISCSHRPWKTYSDATHEVINQADYTDKVSFTVTCDQTIKEWKIAAYTTYPDSEVAGDTVTPMTMHEISTGVYSSTSGYHQTNVAVKTWNVQVDGYDFRAALGGSDQVNKDGIHYIIVFGKNLANTWSIAGTPHELDE